MIAILDVEDEAFVQRAAKRGVFAYTTKERDAVALQSSLDIVLSRFAEYHSLEGAFARRAVIERAKGILMERHAVDERHAFELLRDQARRTNARSRTSPRPSSSASASCRRMPARRTRPPRKNGSGAAAARVPAPAPVRPVGRFAHVLTAVVAAELLVLRPLARASLVSALHRVPPLSPVDCVHSEPSRNPARRRRGPAG
ncbi:MAG: ANTAR domain-containing response regulator, partial [Actinomycetota bacterium]